MNDKDLPACPDCGNPLDYAVKLASVERNHLRLLRCSYCNRAHWFSFDGTVRLVDVPDIDETFSVLKTAGYDLVEPEPVFLAFWKNGCRYFNMIGPDGERLEFNQIL